MKKPDTVVEVFLSLIKWFLLFVLLNNGIWAIVFMTSNSSDGYTAEYNQDGKGNIQEVNNGTAIN